MAKATFDTNPVPLQTLLRNCEDSKLQLPDFQRSWVWEEERIMSLIASVSRGFPMGALMSLKSKIGDGIIFAKRPIEGTPAAAAQIPPEQLLLDGQQRMTSLVPELYASSGRFNHHRQKATRQALVLHRHDEGAQQRDRP